MCQILWSLLYTCNFTKFPKQPYKIGTVFISITHIRRLRARKLCNFSKVQNDTSVWYDVNLGVWKENDDLINLVSRFMLSFIVQTQCERAK